MASNKTEPNLTTLIRELGVSDVTGMDVDKYPGLSTTASEEFKTFKYSWNKLKQYERNVREKFGKKEFDYIFLVYLVGYVNIFICNINNILSQMRVAVKGNSELLEHIKQLEAKVVGLKREMIVHAVKEMNKESIIKGIYFSKYYAIAFVAFFGNSGIFIKDFFRLLQPIVEVVSNQNVEAFASLVDKSKININISDITKIIDTEQLTKPKISLPPADSEPVELQEIYLLIIKITKIFMVLFNKCDIHNSTGEDIIKIQSLNQIIDDRSSFKTILDNSNRISDIIQGNFNIYNDEITQIINDDSSNRRQGGGGKKMTRKRKGKKPQKRTRHHKKNVTRPLRKNKTKPTKRK